MERVFCYHSLSFLLLRFLVMFSVHQTCEYSIYLKGKGWHLYVLTDQWIRQEKNSELQLVSRSCYQRGGGFYFRFVQYLLGKKHWSYGSFLDFVETASLETNAFTLVLSKHVSNLNSKLHLWQRLVLMCLETCKCDYYYNYFYYYHYNHQ